MLTQPRLSRLYFFLVSTFVLSAARCSLLKQRLVHCLWLSRTLSLFPRPPHPAECRVLLSELVLSACFELDRLYSRTAQTTMRPR